jgi:hypothetical protein
MANSGDWIDHQAHQSPRDNALCPEDLAEMVFLPQLTSSQSFYPRIVEH